VDVHLAQRGRGRRTTPTSIYKGLEGLEAEPINRGNLSLYHTCESIIADCHRTAGLLLAVKERIHGSASANSRGRVSPHLLRTLQPPHYLFSSRAVEVQKRLHTNDDISNPTDETVLASDLSLIFP
jgi:hypothetical protein